MEGGERALCGCEVGAAKGPHFTRAPRLVRSPLDRVVAVFALVEVNVEVTFGVESSPDALHDHRIAALREKGGRLFASFFSVRRARE